MIKKRSKPDIIVLLVLMLGLGVTVSSMSNSDQRRPLSQAEIQASGIIISNSQ
ncbi:hypothetical protein QWZ13_00990 [Reinekea marina]|uniref:Uncharacterized protein n=1 Tax=Reinekea marina TaxID=1310421 RepID=A0ABV7WUZ0_9GAMM|nr:hypothetical protein [Reinekea marina]MBU2864327.1 hypothetical protein [Reinekea forsetii]MDN3647478.1 hypothetical protein [Reinekea marina]